MRKTNLHYFLVVTIVIAAALFITGCTRYEEGPADNQTDVASDWQSYVTNDFNFSYPDGWFVELEQGYGDNDELTYSFNVKNTDKEVVLGGAAPDDYYVEVDGKSEVNALKYTSYYALFNVNVTESSEGWESFFEKYYPDRVTEFEEIDLSSLTDKPVARATAHEGVYLGDPRFFIRSDKFVYDIALHVSGVDETEARDLFEKFITNFSF